MTPNLRHLFLSEKILAAPKQMAEPSCWNISQRFFKILPRPFTWNCCHLCSTASLWRESRQHKETCVLYPCTLNFPSSAHGHPQWSTPCPVPGQRHPEKFFWRSWSLAGSFTALMQIQLPTWALGIQFQREYHQKWLLMNYKEPGKYLNSCAAMEVAMKRKKLLIFLQSPSGNA